jgi:hypothetical protein
VRWLAFFLGVALLFPLQERIDERKPELPSALLYTPDRRLMKVIACGHGPLLADLVWVQSTSYIIHEFKTGKIHIEHLYALFDVMTELDPDFIDAYVMGSSFLSSVADEPESALQLLEKGQGPIDEIEGRFEFRKGPEGEPLGVVHPRHRERWKLLNETAAIHLVSFAQYAPSIQERFDEIHTAGRLLIFGAEVYPVPYYTRPDWWREIGEKLTLRSRIQKYGMELTPLDYYRVTASVWEQRLHFTAPDSPLYGLYKRRIDEIASRAAFEGLQLRLGKWIEEHGAPPSRLEELAPKVPDDPLGVGYFLVDGKLVAPGLDAAFIERQLEHEAVRQRNDTGRYPESVDVLRALIDKRRGGVMTVDAQGHPLPTNGLVIPSWVHVDYDKDAGKVTVVGVAPR